MVRLVILSGRARPINIECQFDVNYWDDERSNRVKCEWKSVRASNDAGQLEPIKGDLKVARRRYGLLLTPVVCQLVKRLVCYTTELTKVSRVN